MATLDDNGDDDRPTGDGVENVVCREPNFEDSDEYIDTWQESLSQTITTAPAAKSGCRMPPPLAVGEFIVPRSVF